ncbi:SWAHC protein, partial [Acromyrmex heyeri]
MFHDLLNGSVILIYDFNIDMKVKNYCQNKLRIVNSVSLKQLVNESTRKVNISETIINLIFTNEEIEVTVEHEPKITDHSVILLEKMIECNVNILEGNNVNDLTNLTINAIEKCLDEVAPRKEIILRNKWRDKSINKLPIYEKVLEITVHNQLINYLEDNKIITALHWGAKHGNENIVKLIAGTYKDYIKSVNETTVSIGYTPLHIAMQFGHENIFNLLVQVYGANQDIRDYSGRKARQYLASQEAAVSQDTFHKKDLGFLRIGSLNVRVKRTTEAFSQFLGVATSSTTNNNNEKIHKSWGSADNVQLEQKLMPPPKYAPIKKRRSRRPQDFGSSQERQQVASQPTTPLLQGKMSRPNRTVQRRPTSTTSINSNSIASGGVQQNGDSDSDTTCGFDSAWRGSAQL